MRKTLYIALTVLIISALLSACAAETAGLDGEPGFNGNVGPSSPSGSAAAATAEQDAAYENEWDGIERGEYMFDILFIYYADNIGFLREIVDAETFEKYYWSVDPDEWNYFLPGLYHGIRDLDVPKDAFIAENERMKALRRETGIDYGVVYPDEIIEAFYSFDEERIILACKSPYVLYANNTLYRLAELLQMPREELERLDVSPDELARFICETVEAMIEAGFSVNAASFEVLESFCGVDIAEMVEKA